MGRWMRSLRRKSRQDVLRYFYVGLSLIFMTVFGWGIYRVTLFAQTSELLEIREIQVSGEHRVSKNEILARAGYFSGMNALQINLEKTRLAIEEILWIRHATVRRVWPNQLAVSVVERTPVALARIDSEIYLVDVDGFILPVDALTNTNFPILDGLVALDEERSVDANAFKISIYQETLEVLGESQLSEVHVSDAGDVSVVPVDDAVVVDLGMVEHRIRWEKYLSLKKLIREDYPTTRRIDLRFRDQVIIQTEENEPEDRIIWAEETKLL